jgi:large subunit ribosomal protein L9
MKVILTASVDNLGRAGEVVSVANGYARNFLFPRRLAVEATPGNMKVVSQRRRRFEAVELKRKEEAEELAQTLAELVVSVKKKAGEKGVLYGAVTPAEIADELASRGIEIDKRKIAVEAPIKEVGEFEIPVRIHPEVSAIVKIQVEGE